MGKARLLQKVNVAFIWLQVGFENYLVSLG